VHGREVRADGLHAGDFALQDYRGRSHSLADYRDSKIIVLAVLGTECPLVKLYGNRLAELHQTYSPRGVTFLGLNANVQDSVTEIAAYARAHHIEFPILKDLGNKVVDQLGAERTPEVFVLDKQGTVRYRGRIDDQYGVGYVRDAPARNDLGLALDQLLAGESVAIPATEAVGCHIGRVREPKENAPVTYSNQIARILQQRCIECHREGDIAPFALSDYDEVVGWAEMIREVVRENRMPPWHASPEFGRFANDRSLPPEEKELIDRWVADGAPQGNPSELPAPRQFVSGWQLPRDPDLILTINDEPFEVQAEGEVRYQWFTVDPGFSEDKWLAAAEIQPGNRAVVHHILAFTRPRGTKRRFGERDGFLVGYVPGLRARPLPDGMAKRIPANSELVFQVHYTPIGSVAYDQSRIGLIFADPDEVSHQVETTQAVNVAFEIPPGDANHRVEARTPKAPRDVLLLSLMPHMHLRGKSFRYDVQLPDGTVETLLDVPKYDFNWQTGYRLAEPRALPEGTRIHCVAHFDNSTGNLNNPDPTKNVRWGEQTWDEMMIGYLDVAWPLEAAPDDLAGLFDRDDPQVAAESLIAMLDKDHDGKVARREVKWRMLAYFVVVDVDRDGFVTLEELTTAINKRRQLRHPK
jgi:peroxiredoxin